MERKPAKTATCPGAQNSPIEGQSDQPPPDVYELPGRSLITPKPAIQKEQAKSLAAQVSKGDSLENLSSHERDILERQLSMPRIEASYTMLYRYATKNDIFILVVSTICALASGAITPLMTVCASAD
jgi:hypothetical protein